MKISTYNRKIKNIIKRSKKKATDVTGTIIASPKIIKSKMSIKKGAKDLKTIERARAYDNAPNFNSKGKPTDAYKARSLAKDVKDRVRR
jgi:hypothetical protein